MLKYSFRQVLCAAIISMTPFWTWAQASTSSYPERPVRIIVAFPAGQATDLATRAIAERLTHVFKQPFVVENRPGAASIIGTEAAARSQADGYTLFMGSSGSLAINPGLYKDLPYDAVKDFEPISLTLKVPFFAVTSPEFPVNNIQELVSYLKQHPNEVNLGTAGIGASNHLAAEMFMNTAGVSMLAVPYKGSPPAITDLIAGRLSVMFDTGPVVLPHVQSGKLKLLAVATAEPLSAAPEIVTIAQSGYPGFEAVGWAGLLAPAGTPGDIITKLNKAVVQILSDPEFSRKLAGAELASSTPEEFADYIKSEQQKWGEAIQRAGVVAAR